MEWRKQERGWHGHFLGFRARKDCEDMPVIPAWIVRSNLDDSRKIPYLLVWKDERVRHGAAYRLYDGEVMEAVRLTCHAEPYLGYVELKRTNASTTILRIVWQTLPLNGGRALFLLCSYCGIPRRYVYGWQWDPFSGRSNVVMSVGWRCRSCAQLRYSSEGRALRPRARGRLGAWLRALGDPPLPHPVPWLPFVFASPEEAAEAGICELSSVTWYGKR